MTMLVVDASVAVKWFLPEIHSQAAERILKSGRKLLAPDLIWAEVGNALWKKVRRDEILPEEANGILRDFLRFPVQTYESKILLPTAWDLAIQSDTSVYDALYLSLAIGQNCPLVTADRKFYETFKKSSELWLVWVEDIIC